MTTVDLYKKHKAGGVSREKFLYEVRRDSMLPFITNLTSYSDAVQILKNKGIIREESFPEESAYNQGKAANKSRKNYTDNPYSKDYEPDKYEEWTDGWIDAESEGQMAHDNARFRSERGGMDEAGKDYNPDAAWQEGYDAFEAGSHQEENPYEGDTSEHKNWDMGYEKAQHDGPGMDEAVGDDNSNFIGPENVDARYKKGLELFKQGKTEEAERIRKNILATGRLFGWGEKEYPAYSLNEDPVSDRVEKAIRDKKLDPKLVKKAAEDAERGNSTALATLIATAGMMKEKEEYVSDTSYLEGHDAAFEGYIDELITKAGKNGMPKEFSQIGKAILDDYPNVGRHDYDMFVDYNDDGSIKAIDGSFSPNADDYFGRSSVVFSYDFINNKIIYTEKSGLNEAIKHELTLDTVNPYEFRKGMQWELGYATLPAPNWDQNTVTDEDFAKAGKKVLKNLSSDPNYYTTLISNKGEKPKKVKEVKVEEDGMAKIKGVEKVTANVQTSLGKKERGKKNPEGVKEMRGTKRTFSKIKLIKEGDLNAALDKNLRKLFK